MTTIIGIKILNRMEHAVAVQNILTEFGCLIKTRIGLHEEANGECTGKGLILLELTNDTKSLELINALKNIREIAVCQMIF